jgi:hypothetical protein
MLTCVYPFSMRRRAFQPHLLYVCSKDVATAAIRYGIDAVVRHDTGRRAVLPRRLRFEGTTLLSAYVARTQFLLKVSREYWKGTLNNDHHSQSQRPTVHILMPTPSRTPRRRAADCWTRPIVFSPAKRSTLMLDVDADAKLREGSVSLRRRNTYASIQSTGRRSLRSAFDRQFYDCMEKAPMSHTCHICRCIPHGGEE